MLDLVVGALLDLVDGAGVAGTGTTGATDGAACRLQSKRER